MSHKIVTNLLSVVLLCGAVMLSACAGTNYNGVPQLPTNTTPDAPAADHLDVYRLQIGDVLDIKFYLNPEFDETVTVRPDGMISTKIVQDMDVYNKTVDEVNDELKDLYKEELKDPAVSTIVRSFAPIRIYVSGEVENPGEFIVVGQGLTLTQAIARAGGVKNSADTEHVLVLRRGAGEQSRVYVANYEAASQRGDPREDARLAPYDVVFVPRNGAALAYRPFQQYFQQFFNFSTSASVGHTVN